MPLVKKKGALKIHQDVDLYNGNLAAGQELKYPIEINRHGWIQMIDGLVETGTHKLSKGDSLAISDTNKIKISAVEDSEFLLFDLN